MDRSMRAGLAALLVWASSSAAFAQGAYSPVVSVGAAVAVHCLGYEEDSPAPPVCGGTRYASPGPYLRPYVSVRPIDRLLLTAAVGYVESPRLETPLCCPLSGSFPRGVAVQRERTAWHAVLTGAFVPGRPGQAVRAFVGGGALVFSDTLTVDTMSGDGPSASTGDRETGLAGVFAIGALWRIGAHIEGRVSYTLARRMAAPTTPDTSWRHEFAVGLGWSRGGAATPPNP